MANNILTDFKIILNSADTNSWTGTKFNATYNVDLKQIIRNDSYLDKQYQLTYNFQSIKDGSINSSTYYFLNLQFNNGASNGSIYQPATAPSQATGLLNFITDGKADASGNIWNYFSAGEQDNAPTFISNLRNLNSVLVQVQTSSMAIFTSTWINYALVLHFTEIQGANPYNSAPYSTAQLSHPTLPHR